MARTRFTPEISEQIRKDILVDILKMEKEFPGFSQIKYSLFGDFSITSLQRYFGGFNAAKTAAGIPVLRAGKHNKGGNKHKDVSLIKYVPGDRLCNRCDKKFKAWDVRRNHTCARCFMSERTDFDDLS